MSTPKSPIDQALTDLVRDHGELVVRRVLSGVRRDFNPRNLPRYSGTRTSRFTRGGNHEDR